MAESQLHVALSGNPNCGKTTLFNQITGQNGYVGNWPGVTVEKREAALLDDGDVVITDLPGTYSLSPYSPEERVTRDCLMGGEADVAIELIDATNLERSLYLALQVIETGIPVVVGLNMADLIEKSGDGIDADALSRRLGCPVVEVSALRNTGLDRLIAEARRQAGRKNPPHGWGFDPAVEVALGKIEGLLPPSIAPERRRFHAIGLFECDTDAVRSAGLAGLDAERVEEIIERCEADCDDDAESIIAGERYAAIADIMGECVSRAPAGISITERIDRVVTNRILGLPVFILVMWLVYYLAISTFGTAGTDWVNDGLFGEGFEAFGRSFPSIPMVVERVLSSSGASPLVIGLVNDGIIAGVGAVLGFIPQMLVLFALLAFLEDCGYMARVAFVMDRVFRRFGLSGKSFIPMLVSTGCGVPGILATKAIGNESDRRMTVMTTTFIPCGAKLPIIALLMGALMGSAHAWWISPLFYFLGVAAVIASGIMLKKTRLFSGRPTPFVMELPSYHLPSFKSWWLHVWERVLAYVRKAFTIIFASTIAIWFLSNFGIASWDGGTGAFGFLPGMAGAPEEFADHSVLAMVAAGISWIFAPLGFGSWQATAMSITGLVAKENVVATASSLLSIADGSEASPALWSAFAGMFPTAGAIAAFGAFNLLCAPCFAAMGTIRAQMGSARWTAVALGYECAFAWAVALMINQFYLASIGVFSLWTAVAAAIAALMAFQLLRPTPRWTWDESAPLAAAGA